jgi:Fungal cellulose binding domain
MILFSKATTALTANHVTFITMPDSAEGTDEHLRIGGQDEILMYNRESDDATLPDMSPQGVATSEALPTEDWECLEYHLGTDGSIETWLNSDAIAGLTTAGNPNDSGWTSSSIIPKITGVYFGWESYGGDANTFWYDDVAISSSRVGCSVTGVSSSSVSGSSTAPATTMTTSVSTTTSAVSTTTSAVGTVPLYGQCGGIGWTGGTVCESGTCQANGDYYSQCLP